MQRRGIPVTAPRLEPLTPESLRRVHEAVLDDPVQVVSLLERGARRGIALRGRRTPRGDAEAARIVGIDGATLRLDVENLAGAPDRLLLSFELEGRSYFFTATVEEIEDQSRVRVRLPDALYRTERRDRPRFASPQEAGGPTRVELVADRRRPVEAAVADWSASGIGVEVPEGLVGVTGQDPLRIRYLDGARAGAEQWGVVRHAERASKGGGWKRLGLAVSAVPFRDAFPVDTRESIVQLARSRKVVDRWHALASGLRVASSRALARVTRTEPELPEVEVVDFPNPEGRPLRGIVDRAGDVVGGTAVVIPPAWGRTKETLLPLAATIVETFRSAGEPVVVLRFDGSRRRGESFNELDCLAPGHEHDRFTVSGAVGDLRGAVEFLARDPRFRASRIVLVTFSAASIEARRALVEDAGRRIVGWVSVVGSPDLQSGMRTVSGGIDYFGGAERGAIFGFQEIMGVRVDVDRVARDALEHGLAFLEDARRDMARISVPIVWIHGRNDGWLDLDRVREIMACGDGGDRKLISVPTGHQLRSSREALAVFQLVASEVGHLALGKELPPAQPLLHRLERRRQAERARRPARAVDLKALWKDYLLGREDCLGIELMNATSAYGEFMGLQVAALELGPDERVADLGCGTGPFERFLEERVGWPRGLHVDAVDFVPEALHRAAGALKIQSPRCARNVSWVAADLNGTGSRSLPLRSGAYDAVLASLVLSYLAKPEALLRQVFGLLRPGGRLVVSSMRLDADVSTLFIEGVEELRKGRAREVFGPEGERKVVDSARMFLNDAARVLDLEEEGMFQFWTAEDLEQLVRDVGFRAVKSRASFGNPAQAFIVSAVRP